MSDSGDTVDAGDAGDNSDGGDKGDGGDSGNGGDGDDKNYRWAVLLASSWRSSSSSSVAAAASSSCLATTAVLVTLLIHISFGKDNLLVRSGVILYKYCNFRKYGLPLDEKRGIIAEQVFPVFLENFFGACFGFEGERHICSRNTNFCGRSAEKLWM